MKEDDRWIDYRALPGWGGAPSSDIETDLPDDPLADLSAMITQGEGLRVEYTVELPSSRNEKRNVFKTVVAFANGAGGSIVFGVDDDGLVVGLDDNSDKYDGNSPTCCETS